MKRTSKKILAEISWLNYWLMYSSMETGCGLRSMENAIKRLLVLEIDNPRPEWAQMINDIEQAHRIITEQVEIIRKHRKETLPGIALL